MLRHADISNNRAKQFKNFLWIDEKKWDYNLENFFVVLYKKLYKEQVFFHKNNFKFCQKKWFYKYLRKYENYN